MRSILLLLALTVSTLAQSVGDFVIPQKTGATGPHTQRVIPGGNSKIWGTTSSGIPAALTIGAGLDSTSGVLSATASSEWGGITGALADQTDLQTALNAKLSTATAATTYAPISHNQAWSTITSTPTTVDGYGITDALEASNNLSELASASAARTNLGLDVIVISGNTLLQSNRVYVFPPVDSTHTLPASPNEGDVITLIPSGATWAANPLTIARNGHTINGSAANIEFYTPGPGTGYIRFHYISGGWRYSNFYDAATTASNFAGSYHTQAVGTITAFNLNKLFGSGGTLATGQEITVAAPLSLSAGTLSLGTVAIANGGTGQTSANAARLALLPSITSNALKVLRVNSGATDYELATLDLSAYQTTAGTLALAGFSSITGSIAPANVTGTAAILGANTFTGIQTMPAGAVSSPALTFGDATTGLYRSAANQVAVSIGGVEKFKVTADKTTISSSAGNGDVLTLAGLYATVPIRIGGAGDTYLGSLLVNTATVGVYSTYLGNSTYSLGIVGDFLRGNYMEATDNIIGLGTPSATPASVTLGGSRGYGTNITGGTLNIGTTGTGTGTSGAINFQTHGAGSSGSTPGTLTTKMSIKPSGVINVSSMPTSASGLSSGDLWNDGGTVKIVP